MLHIAKLAVGVRSVDHLRLLQHERAAHGELFHRTRHAPRRRDEILSGGSLFWVVGGVMCVRQAIVGIERDRDDAGVGCAALMLDPTLFSTQPLFTRPFQGWRYLQACAAPPDLDDAGDCSMPRGLERDLRALALL